MFLRTALKGKNFKKEREKKIKIQYLRKKIQSEKKTGQTAAILRIPCLALL